MSKVEDQSDGLWLRSFAEPMRSVKQRPSRARGVVAARKPRNSPATAVRRRRGRKSPDVMLQLPKDRSPGAWTRPDTAPPRSGRKTGRRRGALVGRSFAASASQDRWVSRISDRTIEHANVAHVAPNVARRIVSKAILLDRHVVPAPDSWHRVGSPRLTGRAPPKSATPGRDNQRLKRRPRAAVRPPR